MSDAVSGTINKAGQLELGLDTFGDVTVDESGQHISHAQVIRNTIEQAVLADESGIDFIGLGEHHRPDFAITSPDMVLATIAGRTKRIHLGSAVTVLSSDDPIRVFQRFSTLNAASNGRAEVILGRGSFIESFPLFGFDLKNYEVLFEEKLEIFTALARGESVTWQGSTRPPLNNQHVYPTLEDKPLKAWIGVGGSPESVVRAAHYEIPLMLAVIGGAPARFKPYAELYHRALRESGKTLLPIGLHSHGYVAESDERAQAEYWTDYRAMRDRIGKERGWPSLTREEFDQEIAYGSLYVGSPQTVARKIATSAQLLGLSRFNMKYSAGPLSHSKIMQCIELYGREVIPLVRAMLS